MSELAYIKEEARLGKMLDELQAEEIQKLDKTRTKYIIDSVHGENDVVFLENKSGKRLVRQFDSPYIAEKFVNKVRRSRKLTLISYPIFR